MSLPRLNGKSTRKMQRTWPDELTLGKQNCYLYSIEKEREVLRPSRIPDTNCH